MSSILKNPRSPLLGAVFLMATSAVGPGFLTQTAVFTEQLAAAFAFVILVSIVLDIGAQLNIWQIIGAHRERGQQIANRVLPGSGYLLTAAIVFGGLAFNIGNLSGTGLGLNALTSLPIEYGAIISARIVTIIFLRPSFRGWMDLFTQVMGLLMIALTCYVMFAGAPPYTEALKQSVIPDKIDFLAIITIVGGTVGGYISFAGAHRLLDSGISGKKRLPEIRKASIQAIIVASIMRIVLFLAALSVIAKGFTLDSANPPASIFELGAGPIGKTLFGLVMWAAAITSVIGSAYTSISFLKTWHVSIEKNESKWILGFVYISLGVLLLVGRPVQLLIWAGTINGFILPVALGLLLYSIRDLHRSTDIRIPLWQSTFGWVIVAVMLFMTLNI